MTLTENVKKLFDSEKTGGLILVFTTILSLALTNSPCRQDFWHIDLGGNSVVHWINDGLMTLFFLLIGLELEHELYQGNLSDIKSAMLSVCGEGYTTLWKCMNDINPFRKYVTRSDLRILFLLSEINI
jgi:NhaA family Na+:H+ antiporter